MQAKASGIAVIPIKNAKRLCTSFHKFYHQSLLRMGIHDEKLSKLAQWLNVMVIIVIKYVHQAAKQRPVSDDMCNCCRAALGKLLGLTFEK